MWHVNCLFILTYMLLWVSVILTNRELIRKAPSLLSWEG